MADISFIQRSRIGRGIFLLRKDALEVTISSFGTKSSNRYLLRSIAPDYQLVAHRFWILIIAPLVLGIAAASAGVWILSRPTLPADLAILPALFALALLVASFRGIPRVELFLFFDHWRKPLFFIVRERHQSTECEAFLSVLVDRVECSEHGSPPSSPTLQPRDPSAVRFPEADGERLSLAGQHRWVATVGCGILSAGFPIIAPDEWANLTLMTVLFSTAGGLAFGVMSFVAKERSRLLAVIGIALSFVAPLFY
jgi:hypothetical protein